MQGESVTIQGVIIGNVQEAHELDGFFVQEEDYDADGNPPTSESIFVYCGRGSADCLDVVLSHILRVTAWWLLHCNEQELRHDRRLECSPPRA